MLSSGIKSSENVAKEAAQSKANLKQTSKTEKNGKHEVMVMGSIAQNNSCKMFMQRGFAMQINSSAVFRF